MKSNIVKFYLLKALSIPFTTPIRILYLLSFGLSFAQIGMMELSAAITIVILEIPTGIFADMVGRKASRFIAYFLSLIAFTCMSFGSTATIFIFGWALSGAADAFESGAQDAIVFDSLKELGRESDYLKIKSHFLLIGTICGIVGSIIGAQLYTIDHRLPWYLITLTIVLSMVIFAMVVEPSRLNTNHSLKEQFNKFRQSFRQSISNIDVQKLIALGLILALPMYMFTTLLSQPYLISRGFSIGSLGVIFAIITGVSGFISSFSNKIENIFKKRNSFLLIFTSFAILLISMGLIHRQFVLILVAVFYIVDNYKNVIIDNYLNQSIDSSSRATVLSVQSFVNNVSISVLFVFIGCLIDIFSINVVLVWSGVIVGLVCIPFLTISNRVGKVKL